jgi:hypothetical protein
VIKTNPPKTEKKTIQLNTPKDLHQKIVQCQSIYAIKGRKLTIPDTCNFLLTIATEEELKTLNF